MVVGVLSDTHGHLYSAVRQTLEGVDHIIHAGDIGSREVLAGLRAIAPVTAVRGNCDLEIWAQALPVEAEVELGGVAILVRHVAQRPSGGICAGTGVPDPKEVAGRRSCRVLVTGHTHRASCEEREGVLHLNPGSAGPARFGRPRTMAKLMITPPGLLSVESLVVLDP